MDSKLISSVRDYVSTVDLSLVCQEHSRRHISLAFDGKHLIRTGMNQRKTHPKAQSLGYNRPTIHSELDLFRQLHSLGWDELDKLTLVNIRLSKTGILGMAKPCPCCMEWCKEFFNDIYWSTGPESFSNV